MRSLNSCFKRPRRCAPTRDCELYVISRSPDDADAVWVTEVWTSRDAHRASLEDDRVRELITRARPLIAGLGERFELSTVGGKGLSLTG